MADCCQKMTKRNEEDKKALLSRLNRIVGQMNGVKKMVEEDRYCDDILIQLSAIDHSIRSLSGVILENHMKTCLVRDVQNGNLEVIDEIVDLFRRFQ